MSCKDPLGDHMRLGYQGRLMDPLRHKIQQLLSLGPLPSESEATEEAVTRPEVALRAIQPPLSLEEAVAVVSLFGPDTCFGLAWSLLHLIETAPGWEEYARHLPNEGDWADLLRQRAERSAEAA